MIDLRNLRRISANIVDALVPLIIGAWLLARYLQYRHPELDPLLGDIDDFLVGAYLASVLIGHVLRPREEQADIKGKEPSPRWSGTFVVLATGGAAALVVGTIGIGTGDYWASAIIVIVTIVTAMVVWHFATRHAGEIGEARFTE